MDVRNALAQRQALVLAQGAARGLHLAIDVGLRHVVQIDQHQPRHTASGQRFHGPGAHAAQAHHGHLGRADPGIAKVTVQATQTAETPLEIGILDGITRREILDLAHAQRIETREVRFPLDRMLEADEVFVTSTIRGLFPVTKINSRTIADGKPGPLTRHLSRAWHL